MGISQLYVFLSFVCWNFALAKGSGRNVQFILMHLYNDKTFHKIENLKIEFLVFI